MARPRHYDSPDEFDVQVDLYIKWCKEEKEPLTWTGLALFMGFCSRSEIDNYLSYDGFSHSVKRAKMLVENGYEKRLHGNNPTGAIFALKSFKRGDLSSGWNDKPTDNDDDDENTGEPIEITVKPAKGEVKITHGKPRD